MDKNSSAEMPSYQVMLAMNADDFRKWIVERSERPYRDQLIKEMIVHEEENHSARKTLKEKVSEGEQAALNIFDREKSAGVVKWLDELSDRTSASEKQDFVRDAIFAKAAGDHIHLGTHREFQKFIGDEEV